MCLGCSKEPSHRDGSLEYPQHMFWLGNKKNNFQLHTLIWGPVGGLPLEHVDQSECTPGDRTHRTDCWLVELAPDNCPHLRVLPPETTSKLILYQ